MVDLDEVDRTRSDRAVTFRPRSAKRLWSHGLRPDSRRGQPYLMMSRYYSSSLGRFMAVDPTTRSAVPENPQTWNRYIYSHNNPLLFVDPDGEAALIFINNQTTGATRASFSGRAVASGVQQKFNKAGASASVTVGKPGLLDRLVAFVKGDTVHEVKLVDSPSSKEGAKTAGAMAHTSGADPQTGASLTTEVHTNQALPDNPSTPQNERNEDVANSVAHEAGHELGLSDNTNSPADVMTSAQPAKPLDFSPADAKTLKKATQ